MYFDLQFENELNASQTLNCIMNTNVINIIFTQRNHISVTGTIFSIQFKMHRFSRVPYSTYSPTENEVFSIIVAVVVIVCCCYCCSCW